MVRYHCHRNTGRSRGSITTDEVFVMQCRFCWVPVKKRPEGMGRTWGKGEEDDDKNWVHASTHNDAGNPACHRQFLRDEELEEIETETVEEA